MNMTTLTHKRTGLGGLLAALGFAAALLASGCGGPAPVTTTPQPLQPQGGKTAAPAPGKPAGPKWMLVMDDDGKPGPWYLRGQLASGADRLKKTLNLDVDPAVVKEAQIGYLVIHAPYFPDAKKYSDKRLSAMQPHWPMLIALNGTALVKKDVTDLGTTGWHWVPVSQGLLRQGANEVVFSLPEGGASVYLAIDPDKSAGRSTASKDKGKTWSDVLDPTHIGKGKITATVDGKQVEVNAKGEYMVHLKFQSP